MPDADLRADAVVRRFLEAMEAGDVDGALALVDEGIEYTNVPLPPIRGRDRVARVLGPLQGRVGFRVHLHNVAASDGIVLTERTDALVLGPVHWQFWVYGRFEVVDGRITVWRDSFDQVDLLVGLVRGLLAVAWPTAGRRWPTD